MNFPRQQHRALALAILSLSLSTSAVAQGTGGGTSGGAAAPAAEASGSTATRSGLSVEPGRDAAGGALSPQERLFVEKAALGGMAEVALGKLAQEKASRDEVEEFGKVMVRDHGEANEELEDLAQNKGVALPSELDATHRQSLQKLEQLSDADFDRAYISQMLSDHKTTIAEYERQSNQGQDLALKSFAAKNLLVLRQHLKMAETIDRKLHGN